MSNSVYGEQGRILRADGMAGLLDRWAAERAVERERACKHPIPHDHCQAPLDSTVLCEGGCGKFFCPDHLYDGQCKACFDAWERI